MKTNSRARKRLLFVVPNIISFTSFLNELSWVLANNGVKVHCACVSQALWDTSERPSSSDAQIHNIPFARGLNPVRHIQSSFVLNRLVETLRPDLVHAHFSAAIFTTALARRYHWPATIGTFHGVGFPLMTRLRARLLRIAEAWAAQRLDAAWVLTEDDRLALQLAAPKAKVNRQPGYGFGCDLKRFDPMLFSESNRQVLLARLGLNSTHRVFAFIGRYVNFKGFALTIRSFLHLAPSDSRVRLLLIGAPDPLHSTGLTPAEEVAYRQCPQIIDVGWQKDVQNYLAITHVVVFPGQREGMPVSLMEALAMGIPVITQDSRGCRDVVRDQQDGFVLKDCTVKCLTEAMKRLADDESLRRRFSEQALAGRERFSRQHYIQTQIQIYESLLQRSIA